MRNHLRSGFYLLARNPYVWVSVALIVARWAWGLVRVAQGELSFGLQDSILRDKLVLLVYAFSAAGIAAFDQRGRALRCACEDRGGRARYMASRFVLVAVLALGLVALSTALDLVGGALVPGASRIVASPQMHEPARLLAGVLTVLVGCEFTFFVGTLVKSPSALLTTALCVLVCLGAMLLAVLVPGAAGLLDVVTPTAGLLTGIVFQPLAALMPLDPARAYLVPIVWLAALFALSRLLLARRTV
ncbi:hypothetical protein [Olsenella profusa]|uniref:ABC transporter permease n=1 Tax=Olsenella profusa TaxID=138595 RepID=A0ABS2F178_9ACTN|nr:hypothetical protein [Olsenella profusa]MBM6774289.1 hypothetical protein [Olsenella profusa]